ncbi:hypothetical protein [Dyadobacter sandarakinus]|uniref:Lipoprotein n=1 Tax=Dyadobacter sandarakinus TaxID=2747268 RepID=A0ABX7IAA6_9BACT|nr:hypothetical protein [Dyadobacter sandarakinus]QRR01896.1 hypothetical protein HWI92_13755 [Dyadobacter sandarakinus]
MKNYVLAALMLVCTSCKNTTVDRKDEEIMYKQSVLLNDVPKATLTFFDVQDSRCPQGVQCFWAGNATVDLLLSGVTAEGGVNEHVKMCLGDCRTLYKMSSFKMADTLTKRFADENYRLILTAVNPAAKVDSTGNKEKRSILLKIEKQ